MTLQRQACLGICILFSTIYGGYAQTVICTEAAVNGCMAPLISHEKSHGEVYGAVVPYYNEEQMRGICNVFNHTTEPCLLEITPSCPFLTKKIFDGKLAAYNYMCDHTLELYLQYQPCLNNSDLQYEASKCWDSYRQGSKDIDPLFQNASTLQTYAKKLCLYVNKYLDCVFEIVKSECGPYVAHWNRILDERSVRNYVCSFGCSIVESDILDCKGYKRLILPGPSEPSGDDQWEYIVIGVVIAVVVITILTIALLIYMLCVRPKQEPTTQPRQSGDPPAGTVVMYHKGGKTVIPPELQEMADRESKQGPGEFVNPGFSGNIEDGQAPSPYAQMKEPALHRDQMWQSD